MKTLRVQLLAPHATMPAYAHPGDAGMDFFASESVLVKPRQRVLVHTGVAIALPKGTVGLLWDKSGIANNHGLKVLGGVVDAGYRGEVLVGLLNTSAKSYRINAGDKIAQMLVQDVCSVRVQRVTSLSTTTRGKGGFGSTGK